MRALIKQLLLTDVDGDELLVGLIDGIVRFATAAPFVDLTPQDVQVLLDFLADAPVPDPEGL